MRDGLSLLDQAIVFGNGKVSTEAVSAMLGTVAQQPVEDILTALANADAVAILDKINEIADLTPDFSDVLQQILQVLHRVALQQHLPTALDQDFDADMIASLAAQFTPEDVQLYYQIGLLGQKDLDLAPDPRSGFEMVMLRMLTFKPAATASKPVKPAPAVRPAMNKTVLKPDIPQQTAVVAEKSTEQAVANKREDNWIDMIAAMRLGGMTRELANNCVLQAMDDKVCTLILDAGHKQLRSAVTEEKLQKALQAYRGSLLKLVIKSEKAAIETPAVQLAKEREDRQQAAVDAINSDENIQALKEQFDARVLPGTIEPV
jgi:DNA polymerase-3 subunit gamma/tau